jgi:hypothetical protein
MLARRAYGKPFLADISSNKNLSVFERSGYRFA